MTPPIVKKLIAEKASASRKEDTAKFIKSCEDLGEWFRDHFRHKETIGEYMELVDLRKVKISITLNVFKRGCKVINVERIDYSFHNIDFRMIQVIR